jgi:hypothetical protein
VTGLRRHALTDHRRSGTKQDHPGAVELLAPLGSRCRRRAVRTPGQLAGAAREAPAVRNLGSCGLQEFRDGQVWVDLRLVTARTAVLAAKDNRRGDEPPMVDAAVLNDVDYRAITVRPIDK